MCRSMRRVQNVDKTTSSAEEDNWDYEKIQSIENTKQKKGFYNATLLVNNVPIKFIIDGGSPVTLIPECLFSKITSIEPLKTTYKDVNNQKISFTGQTIAMVKTNEETMELPLLITKAQTAPLIGLDWMQRLKINLNSNNDAIQTHNINLDNTERKIIKLQNDFKHLFILQQQRDKESLGEMNLKTGAQIIQQKGRPIPIHLQDQVEQELKRLIKHGYVEKATEITKNCFISPAVITVKKDKSRKIALDSRKLNKITVKRKAQMPNMEELISRISKKISEGEDGEVLATKLDFDNAYGQNKLDEDTKKLCIFTVTGGNFTGYYRFLKGFYGLADIPTIFQERIDTTLEHKHPAWLDDIIIVTKGNLEKHEMEVRETMTKLERAGYKLNSNKC